MPEPRRILFAGGGTGGHLFPAVAVAEQLSELAPEATIEFFVTQRPIDAQILEPTPWSFTPQPVRPFSTKPWHWPAFWMAWRRGVAQGRRAMQSARPDVVVGTGGYGAGAPIQAAHDLGIARALLNPDLKPGRANRHLGRLVDAVFCQWEPTARAFGGVSVVLATGCPVRRRFREASRDEGCEVFGLDPNRRTLLVTGASQGARTVNRAMVALLDELEPQRDAWQVLHLSGRLDYDEVCRAYEVSTLHAVVLPFTDRMAEAIGAADLVVSRAGASTLAELTAVGRPAVLLPYPYHRDMHQAANAAVLADAGAAVALTDQIDPQANKASLGPVLTELMGYPERLSRMADAAARVGRPDAARVVAEHVLKMAEST